jgi:hypothetical protein
MYTDTSLPMFQRSVLPPSSGRRMTHTKFSAFRKLELALNSARQTAVRSALKPVRFSPHLLPTRYYS